LIKRFLTKIETQFHTENRFHFGYHRQGDFWFANWGYLFLSLSFSFDFIRRSSGIFHYRSTRRTFREWEPSAGITTIVTLCCVIITRWERCQGALAGKREGTEGKEAGRRTTIRSRQENERYERDACFWRARYTCSRAFFFFAYKSLK